MKKPTASALLATVRRATAATYLDMREPKSERGVLDGVLLPIKFIQKDRWRKAEDDAALERAGGEIDEWRSRQPLYQDGQQAE